MMSEKKLMKKVEHFLKKVKSLVIKKNFNLKEKKTLRIKRDLKNFLLKNVISSEIKQSKYCC